MYWPSLNVLITQVIILFYLILSSNTPDALSDNVKGQIFNLLHSQHPHNELSSTYSVMSDPDKHGKQKNFEGEQFDHYVAVFLWCPTSLILDKIWGKHEKEERKALITLKEERKTLISLTGNILFHSEAYHLHHKLISYFAPQTCSKIVKKV